MGREMWQPHCWTAAFGSSKCRLWRTTDQEIPFFSYSKDNEIKLNRYKPLKNVPKCWVLDPLQLVDAVIFHCLLKQTLDFSIFLGIVAELYQLKNFKHLK